jgi:hypothetical protein
MARLCWGYALLSVCACDSPLSTLQWVALNAAAAQGLDAHLQRRSPWMHALSWLTGR